MDNLPSDPSNPNNGNNNNPPPPFGSGFDPHTNPIDPNNPYVSQPQPNPVPLPPQTLPPNLPNTPENPDALKHEHYSEAAQNKPRDEHGHFIHTNTNPDPQTPLTSPNPPNTPNPSLPNEASAKLGFLPPIIEINQNTKPTGVGKLRRNFIKLQIIMPPISITDVRKSLKLLSATNPLSDRRNYTGNFRKILSQFL